jgi:hypothetical protein
MSKRVFLFLACIGGLLLVACAKPTVERRDAPTASPPSALPTVITALSSSYPPPATAPAEGYIAPPTPQPTLSPGPYVPSPTMIVLPTATPPPFPTSPPPLPTFGPSPTPFPTFPPPPTLIPTVNPTELPGLLLSNIQLDTTNGLSSHPLQRITGWDYGFRPGYYCELGAYRWLDDSHLLLFPLTGQEEGMAISYYTLPAVVNLRDSQMWLPPTNGPTRACDLPLWSEALQVVIATTAQEVILFTADGQMNQRFPGELPLYSPSYLSPSGRRLLTGSVWRDLETGQTVEFKREFESKHPLRFTNPAWTSDEIRVASCCFAYDLITSIAIGDVASGGYQEFSLKAEPPGRDPPGPGYRGCQSYWVLDDTRALTDCPFIDSKLRMLSNQYRNVVPLVDPASQTSMDICEQIGLWSCSGPKVAPDGEHIVVYSDQIYLINLQTFITHTLPTGYGFISWSPDSQFILISRELDPQTNRGGYDLFSVQGAFILISDEEVISPIWSPNNAQLAFVRADGQAVVTADLANSTVFQVKLLQPAGTVVWNPQGNSLVVLAEDGSLWWVPDPGVDRVEQLTPPLPEVRDVRWSPSGDQIAFISDKDVYVVRVTQN